MQKAFNFLTTDALVSVSGPDAQKYLQGQLTCDLNAVSLKKASLGAYCNLKGRCVAVFRIIQIAENDYIFRLNKTTVPKFLAQLKKYAMFSKCTIEDVSEKWQGYVIKSEIAGNPYDTFTEDGHTITKLEQPLKWWQWIAPKETPLPAEFEITEGSSEWLYDEIVCGIPSLSAETQEAFLPHHLNLPELGAVSFNKGCFLGQEIIARMQNLGKIKKHLYRFHSDQKPMDDQIEIVNMSEAPEGGYSVLAIIADEVAEQKGIRSASIMK